MRHVWVIIGLMLVLSGVIAQPVTAQSPPDPTTRTVWLQIAARASREEAEIMAEDYGWRLDQIGVHETVNGGYAVALGPEPAKTAPALRDALVAAGFVPEDAFMVASDQYLAQVWPAEALGLAPGTPADPALRANIQRALAWFGHYNGAIDGVFGPGTRTAIASWQTAQGLAASQRLDHDAQSALVAAWQEDWIRAGFVQVRLGGAGLAVDVPQGLVDFVAYAPPLVLYQNPAPDGIRLALISLRATQDPENAALSEADLATALAATAGIALPQGAGSTASAPGGAFWRQGGRSMALHLLPDAGPGVLKGFVLSGPEAEAGLLSRVAQHMAASLRSTGPFVLPRGIVTIPADVAQSLRATPPVAPSAPPTQPSTAQQPDLTNPGPPTAPAVSSRPIPTAAVTPVGPVQDDVLRHGTALAIDGKGGFLAQTDTVLGCAGIMLEDGTDLRIVVGDAVAGLAYLRPRDDIARTASARLAWASQVPQPGNSLTAWVRAFAGKTAAQIPVSGAVSIDQQGRLRLGIETHTADAGAPVVDVQGRLIGVLAPTPADDPAGGWRHPYLIGTAEIDQWLTHVAGVQSDPAPETQNAQPAKAALRIVCLR